MAYNPFDSRKSLIKPQKSKGETHVVQQEEAGEGNDGEGF